MATRVNGPYNRWGTNLFEFRSFFTYEVTTNNATTYAVQIVAGIQVGNNNGTVGVSDILVGVSGTSQTLKQTTTNFYTTEINGENIVYPAFTWSWAKDHSSKSVTIAAAILKSGVLEQSRGAVTLTIPAKTSYKVTYNANSGTGAPSSQTKWYGESLKISTTKPTRTGYTFTHWRGSNNVNYDPGDTIAANVNQNITLTAQWSIITYTIKYNANGGTGTIANQSKNYGASVTLSSGSGFSRTNYELTGWNTKANGSGTSYNKSGSYSANASVTLYAQWTLSYTNPILSSVHIYKCDSSGTAKDDGTYIHVDFNYTGGKKGDGTYVVPNCKITIQTGSTTATVYNQSLGSTSGSFSNNYGTYSADVTHTVTIVLSDSFGSVTRKRVVPTALYPLDFLGSANDDALYMGVMTPAVNGVPLTLAGFTTTGDIVSGGNVTDVDGNILSRSAQKLTTSFAPGSHSWTVGGASRGLIICTGAAAGFLGLYIYVTNTGATTIYTKAVSAATNVTVSSSGSTLTVTNTASSGTLFVTLLALTGNVPT